MTKVSWKRATNEGGILHAAQLNISGAELYTSREAIYGAFILAVEDCQKKLRENPDSMPTLTALSNVIQTCVIIDQSLEEL